MQITKKVLALVLTLALTLSCIPALTYTAFAATEYEYYDVTAENAITLHGVHYDSTNQVFARMDLTSAAAQNGYNNGIHTYAGTVHWHMREAAGGRIRLSTDSTSVSIQATLRSWNSKHYATAMGAGKYGFDVYVDTPNGSIYAGSVKASSEDIAKAKTKWEENELDNIYYTSTDSQKSDLNVTGTIDLSQFTPVNGSYNLTIYFPITMETSHVEIGVEKGATVAAHNLPYNNEGQPIVFYGSSITQGGSSTKPGNAYTAVTSRLLNAEYHSFGMWGSCTGQTNVAEYLAGLEMSVFVLDYDHNDTKADTFQPKHWTVYETVRAAHPDIPIIMITRPNRNQSYNSTQSPIEDMKAKILQNYNSAVAAGDKNVHFIDGEAFFEYDGSLITDTTYKYNKVFLQDGVHPTDAGQAAMADVVASVIRLANAGYENIYFDLDEISFGGNKEDIVFDSTDAVDPMTSANWTSGTVSGKALKLAAGQNATLQGIENLDKLSGYTAVAALNIAQNASATVTIGGKTVTVSANGTVTSDSNTGSFIPVPNANGSVDVVLQVTCINNGFNVYVNSNLMFHAENGVMGGAPSFGAANGSVTVQSLMITVPAYRAYYTAALGDKIGLNIHMTLTEGAAADTGSYMVFTCGNETSDELPLPAPEDDGTYKFNFEVAAKEMTNDITAAFYNSNGDMIAKHVTTIKSYADYIIGSDNYNANDKKIAKALLNYGAAAQEHFVHNTANLANGGFAPDWANDLNASALTPYAPTANEGAVAGVEFYGSSLILEGRTTIRHYFKMDAATAAGITATVDSQAAKLAKSGSYYYVDITGVDAANLDYFFTLVLTDGTSSYTVKYSALTYVYQMLNPPAGYTPNASMVKLAKALFLYSDTVSAPVIGDNEFEPLPF